MKPSAVIYCVFNEHDIYFCEIRNSDALLNKSWTFKRVC